MTKRWRQGIISGALARAIVNSIPEEFRNLCFETNQTSCVKKYEKRFREELRRYLESGRFGTEDLLHALASFGLSAVLNNLGKIWRNTFGEFFKEVLFHLQLFYLKRLTDVQKKIESLPKDRREALERFRLTLLTHPFLSLETKEALIKAVVFHDVDLRKYGEIDVRKLLEPFPEALRRYQLEISRGKERFLREVSEKAEIDLTQLKEENPELFAKVEKLLGLTEEDFILVVGKNYLKEYESLKEELGLKKKGLKDLELKEEEELEYEISEEIKKATLEGVTFLEELPSVKKAMEERFQKEVEEVKELLKAKSDEEFLEALKKLSEKEEYKEVVEEVVEVELRKGKIIRFEPDKTPTLTRRP